MGGSEIPLSPSPSPTAPGPKPASRRFVVLVGITTAVVVIAALVGFALLRDRQPDASGLGNKVRDSMNESLSRDEQYQKIGLHITALTILHVVGTMFEGDATAATNTSSDHTVPVHITYDGDTMFWRTDPGAFAFTVQEQLQGSS